MSDAIVELHDRPAAVDPEGLEKLVQKPFDMRALADLLDRTAPAA